MDVPDLPREAQCGMRDNGGTPKHRLANIEWTQDATLETRFFCRHSRECPFKFQVDKEAFCVFPLTAESLGEKSRIAYFCSTTGFLIRAGEDGHRETYITDWIPYVPDMHGKIARTLTVEEAADLFG